jgi:kynurenine formamidase
MVAAEEPPATRGGWAYVDTRSFADADRGGDRAAVHPRRGECLCRQRRAADPAVGGDTWATEAVPGEGAQPFECHIKMTKRGIWNLENLDFHQLLADKAYEFLFVWSPLKMKGATGSPGNPVALY